MRLIDADKLNDDLKIPFKGLLDPRRMGLNMAIEMVKDSPTIDAVEVVRCGECEYFETDECRMIGYCEGCDCRVDLGFNSTGYCAKGKRKDGAT